MHKINKEDVNKSLAKVDKITNDLLVFRRELINIRVPIKLILRQAQDERSGGQYAEYRHNAMLF